MARRPNRIGHAFAHSQPYEELRALVCATIGQTFAMLYVISPAKTLDYESPVEMSDATHPLFVEQAAELIEVLKRKSPEEISELMSLSPALTALNVRRFQEWRPEFSAETARPAVLTFNGDVYEGLDARSLSRTDLDWAQEHLVILSGLYGVLRPLDLMRPYRLEMGTRLEVGRARNLYEFWGDRLAHYISERLQQQGGEPILVNVASEEYFKSVRRPALKARVIQCVFEDWKSGTYKVISFHAKRARGLLVRFAVQNRIDQPAGLCDFNLEGYAFAAEASDNDRLVFRRKQAG